MLHLVDELFEKFLADLHNNVGVHLDKTSVAVPRPTGIARLVDHDLDDFFVQSEVKDGVHHAGHGSARTGTDGNKQRIFFVAELFAYELLHLFDILHYLCAYLIINDFAVLIILCAGFGGDGEALRNRQTNIGHFSKVCTLSAEQFAHLCVAFGKQIDILFAHSLFSSSKNHYLYIFIV